MLYDLTNSSRSRSVIAISPKYQQYKICDLVKNGTDILTTTATGRDITWLWNKQIHDTICSICFIKDNV